MSIPEPILVVYGEAPKAIATSDLRQARVDEFLASRSLQPKSHKAYQADLRKYELDPSLAMELTRHRDVKSFRRYTNRKNKIAAKRAFLKAAEKLE